MAVCGRGTGDGGRGSAQKRPETTTPPLLPRRKREARRKLKALRSTVFPKLSTDRGATTVAVEKLRVFKTKRLKLRLHLLEPLRIFQGNRKPKRAGKNISQGSNRIHRISPYQKCTGGTEIPHQGSMGRQGIPTHRLCRHVPCQKGIECGKSCTSQYITTKKV